MIIPFSAFDVSRLYSITVVWYILLMKSPGGRHSWVGFKLIFWFKITFCLSLMLRLIKVCVWEYRCKNVCIKKTEDGEYILSPSFRALNQPWRQQVVDVQIWPKFSFQIVKMKRQYQIAIYKNSPRTIGLMVFSWYQY